MIYKKARGRATKQKKQKQLVIHQIHCILEILKKNHFQRSHKSALYIDRYHFNSYTNHRGDTSDILDFIICESPLCVVVHMMTYFIFPFFSWTVRIWVFNDPFCVKRLRHKWQRYGFSPVCTRICTLRLFFTANRFEHCVHPNGLSPVCVLMWSFRLFHSSCSEGQRDGDDEETLKWTDMKT